METTLEQNVETALRKITSDIGYVRSVSFSDKESTVYRETGGESIRANKITHVSTSSQLESKGLLVMFRLIDEQYGSLGQALQAKLPDYKVLEAENSVLITGESRKVHDYKTPTHAQHNEQFEETYVLKKKR